MAYQEYRDFIVIVWPKCGNPRAFMLLADDAEDAVRQARHNITDYEATHAFLHVAARSDMLEVPPATDEERAHWLRIVAEFKAQRKAQKKGGK